jgi:hypothetical protein
VSTFLHCKNKLLQVEIKENEYASFSTSTGLDGKKIIAIELVTDNEALQTESGKFPATLQMAKASYLHLQKDANLREMTIPLFLLLRSQNNGQPFQIAPQTFNFANSQIQMKDFANNNEAGKPFNIIFYYQD